MTSNETEKASLTIVVPTLGRKSLKAAIESCGEIPTIVERDTHRTGAGPTRNRAIHRVTTEWVGFLDDDDTLTSDYERRFREVRHLHPDAEVIIFRTKYPDGTLLPKVPLVQWGNVTINFCAKTHLLKKHPFVKGEDGFQRNEDYLALKTLEESGARIHFSPHITYLVKPSGEAQANARVSQLQDKD